jgi:hypothetical protein
MRPYCIHMCVCVCLKDQGLLFLLDVLEGRYGWNQKMAVNTCCFDTSQVCYMFFYFYLFIYFFICYMLLPVTNRPEGGRNARHWDVYLLIKRTNSMHQYADIYLLQRQTLHVLGVTAPILRSASSWSFLLILNHDARNHEFKMYTCVCIAVGLAKMK